MLITCLWLLNYIYCIKYKMLNQFFFLLCFQQLPPVSEIIVESHARASKANLAINPVREVLVVTWQYSRQSIHPSAHTTGQQCEISHFFAGVRACNLILYIRVVVNWLLSKQSMHWPVSDDLLAGRGVDPSRLRVFMKLSKLRVFNSKCKSFAFSLD